MQVRATNKRHRQRGAAALAVSLLLLFGVTVAAFFANRTMIFEQRSSANQYRATKAFELADAGLEWAIARLNDPLTLAAGTCAAATGTGLVSFRGRYARPSPADATHPTGWFNAVGTAAFPGCQIPTSGVPQPSDCGCPAAGGAVLAATDLPRFRVQFNTVASDSSSLEIVSRGCTSGDPCDPNQPISANTDSTAVARVVVKIVPTFPGGGPRAGLISGSTTVVSGSLNVVNTDTRTNGITINSGSVVDLATSGVSVVSLPGTPPAASILDNDPSLLQLTNADANGELFFMSFLGTGFDDYRSSPLTVVINSGSGNNAAGRTCSGAIDCGGAVSYWVDRGYSQFWVVPDVTFNNSNMPSTTGGTLGTDSRPIVLATPGQLTTTGGITAYGVLYAASARAVDDLTLSGGGNSTVFGSLITRGDFARTGNGGITIVPRSRLFGDPGPPGGLLIPVPGSWRDKATPY
jgi:hypothetical protein